MNRLARRNRALALGLAALASGFAPAGARQPPEPTPQVPLELAEALALAREGSEVTGVAAARIERARAVRRQAVAALLPSLTISGTYTRRAREVTREVGGDQVTVQALDAFSGQAIADTTLFDLRALPLLRAATSSLEAQRIESSELERALAFDVADTFFAVLGADGLLAAAEGRVRVAEATVAESRLRLEAGLANRNDLTRAELELATARLGATQAVRDAEAARLSLGYLMAAPTWSSAPSPGGRRSPRSSAGGPPRASRRWRRGWVSCRRSTCAAPRPCSRLTPLHWARFATVASPRRSSRPPCSTCSRVMPPAYRSRWPSSLCTTANSTVCSAGCWPASAWHGPGPD